jgi:YARHG domain
MTVRVMALALAIAGCNAGGDAPTVATNPVAGSAAPQPVATTAPAVAPAAAPALSPKIAAARCGEPCLFLTDTPLRKLQEAYAAACAGMKAPDLGFENCKEINYTRNCIYAAHGLVSKKRKWRVFTAKPWYEPNPAFASKMISAVERETVRELYNRGKACARSMRITGTDYKLLEKWFADARKGTIAPATITLDDPAEEYGKLARPQALAKWLAARLVQGSGRSLTFKDATASYVDPVPEAFKDIQPEPGGKLRTVAIDLSPAITNDEAAEIINLWFLIDDHDRIRAIDASSYLND